MKLPSTFAPTSFKNVVVAHAAIVRSFFGRSGLGSAAIGHQSHCYIVRVLASPIRYRNAIRPIMQLWFLQLYIR